MPMVLLVAVLTAGWYAPALAEPPPAGTAVTAPGRQMELRRCRLALPAARRLVGLSEAVARSRFRSPRGVVVRYCAMCTRDYRPNRLTFGLDGAQIVRSASCG
jgi:hypothetical protein